MPATLRLLRPSLPQVSWGAAEFASRAAGWWRRLRERRALAALDDGLLRDIGLTRADVDREYDRPFWQPLDYEALNAARYRSGPRLGASKPDRR